MLAPIWTRGVPIQSEGGGGMQVPSPLCVVMGRASVREPPPATGSDAADRGSTGANGGADSAAWPVLAGDG